MAGTTGFTSIGFTLAVEQQALIIRPAITVVARQGTESAI